MDTPELLDSFITKVARSADLTLKPWIHSVIVDDDSLEDIFDNKKIDLILRVECRSKDGERFPNNDLEVEIYRSGSELNIVISFSQIPNMPILWQGKHSVWMDGESGKRCQAPESGEGIESLARRLRSIISV